MITVQVWEQQFRRPAVLQLVAVAARRLVLAVAARRLAQVLAVQPLVLAVAVQPLVQVQVAVWVSH